MNLLNFHVCACPWVRIRTCICAYHTDQLYKATRMLHCTNWVRPLLKELDGLAGFTVVVVSGLNEGWLHRTLPVLVICYNRDRPNSPLHPHSLSLSRSLSLYLSVSLSLPPSLSHVLPLTHLHTHMHRMKTTVIAAVVLPTAYTTREVYKTIPEMRTPPLQSAQDLAWPIKATNWNFNNIVIHAGVQVLQDVRCSHMIEISPS